MRFSHEARREQEFSKSQHCRMHCSGDPSVRFANGSEIGNARPLRHLIANDQIFANGPFHSTENENRSRAFTILELLIVLVLMLAVLAIAWPQISRRIQRSAIKQVAISLKEEIADARLSAIESGETWELRFDEVSNQYELGPSSSFAARSLQGNQSNQPTIRVGTQSSSSQVQTSPAATSRTELDSSIILTTVDNQHLTQTDNANQRRGFETFQVGGGDGQGDDQRLNVVKITPDGRATAMSFMVVDRKSRIGIGIEIRGLTGQVEIGEFIRVDAAFEVGERSFNSTDRGNPEEQDLDLVLEN